MCSFMVYGMVFVCMREARRGEVRRGDQCGRRIGEEREKGKLSGLRESL